MKFGMAGFNRMQKLFRIGEDLMEERHSNKISLKVMTMPE